MNRKQRKTLEAIFARPTRADISFADIESLILSLGGEVKQGAGSRVCLRMGHAILHVHRPHPNGQIKKYLAEEIRAWLTQQGISP